MTGAEDVPFPPANTGDKNLLAWRKVLWTVLLINGVMFVVEFLASWYASSIALRADALDFLEDTINYLIALLASLMALQWRARAAVLIGMVTGAIGLWVLSTALYRFFSPVVPGGLTMASVSLIALVANIVSAWMLWRFRKGESAMKAVWMSSRNDALANIAVLIAALFVLDVQNHWPDLIVGLCIAAMFLWSTTRILKSAFAELRGNGPAVP